MLYRKNVEEFAFIERWDEERKMDVENFMKLRRTFDDDRAMKMMSNMWSQAASLAVLSKKPLSEKFTDLPYLSALMVSSCVTRTINQCSSLT